MNAGFYGPPRIADLWTLSSRHHLDSKTPSSSGTDVHSEGRLAVCGNLSLRATPNWKDYVVVDEQFFRPAEIFELKGDCRRAQTKLGWKPEYAFEDLVKAMVHEDLKILRESGVNEKGTAPMPNWL